MEQANLQILTSFPNQNEKHIDYVICYKKIDESVQIDEESHKKGLARQAFFKKLKEEKFDIHEIVHKKMVFVLLHCQMERLLEEAEMIRLEMKLKDVK